MFPLSFAKPISLQTINISAFISIVISPNKFTSSIPDGCHSYPVPS